MDLEVKESWQLGSGRFYCSWGTLLMVSYFKQAICCAKWNASDSRVVRLSRLSLWAERWIHADFAVQGRSVPSCPYRISGLSFQKPSKPWEGHKPCSNAEEMNTRRMICNQCICTTFTEPATGMNPASLFLSSKSFQIAQAQAIIWRGVFRIYKWKMDVWVMKTGACGWTILIHFIL